MRILQWTLSSGLSDLVVGLHTLAVDLIATFSSRGKTKLQTIGRDSNTVCNVYHGDMLNLQHKDWRYLLQIKYSNI